ncbi:MAG: hypothetical protein ACYDCG_09530 [Candidatus Acidiferrales bacterium]
MGKQKPRTEVFLNLPYDSKFENLYLSYICAIYAFGMVPRVTLEIPGGARRLDRIFGLIQGCGISVHDLSRVELDRKKPRTPRFNMPFELGLAVGWEKIGGGRHVWFVMEAKDYRLEKSLSDLKGTDPYIHGGTIEGVFREIGNAFVRQGMQPTVPQMRSIYRHVENGVPAILRRCGAASVFQARAFKEISIAASAAAGAIVG